MSTAQNIGAVALIDVGTQVWERKPEEADYDPRGGIVLTTEVRPLSEDDPTPVRHFLVVDPFRTRPFLTYHHLAESDVDPATVMPADMSRLANLVRRICEEVAFSGKGRPRKGLMTPDQANLVSQAHRLTTVIFGGVR